MPARTMPSKTRATKDAKRSAKQQTRQAPARTAHLSKGKEKQVVHRETFKGPNPMWKVYVEIPVRISRPLAPSIDSSCIVSVPPRKSSVNSMTKRQESESSSAALPTPVRPRRVILKLSGNSSPPSSDTSWTRIPSSPASSSRTDAAGPSQSSSSNGDLAIDPDMLAQSLDQYDESEDPHSFDTLVVPSRSPDTEKKSFYVGDGCDPRVVKQLKRKRSSESLSNHNSSSNGETSKRSRLVIRVPVRRPKPIEVVGTEGITNVAPQRRSSGGKELSRVLELVQNEHAAPVFQVDGASPIAEDAVEFTGSAHATEESTELCSMCASWKKALGSPGSHDWLAPAGPEECEHCSAKASEKSSQNEVDDEQPEMSLDLPPSFTRTSNDPDAVISPLEGPEAIDEALLLEEARAAASDSDVQSERTPSLSSSRSSVSLETADHPVIDLDDFELGYPDSFEPSPLSSPHPQIVEYQAEFMRNIERYYEQAAAWAAAHAQAEINSELQHAEMEVIDKYSSEEVATLSDNFQMAVDLSSTDSDSGSLDSTDSDVNMADWLSGAAVSSSPAIQV